MRIKVTAEQIELFKCLASETRLRMIQLMRVPLPLPCSARSGLWAGGFRWVRESSLRGMFFPPALSLFYLVYPFAAHLCGRRGW